MRTNNAIIKISSWRELGRLRRDFAGRKGEPSPIALHRKTRQVIWSSLKRQYNCIERSIRYIYL